MKPFNFKSDLILPALSWIPIIGLGLFWNRLPAGAEKMLMGIFVGAFTLIAALLITFGLWELFKYEKQKALQANPNATLFDALKRYIRDLLGVAVFMFVSVWLNTRPGWNSSDSDTTDRLRTIFTLISLAAAAAPFVLWSWLKKKLATPLRKDAQQHGDGKKQKKVG